MSAVWQVEAKNADAVVRRGTPGVAIGDVVQLARGLPGIVGDEDVAGPSVSSGEAASMCFIAERHAS